MAETPSPSPAPVESAPAPKGPEAVAQTPEQSAPLPKLNGRDVDQVAAELNAGANPDLELQKLAAGNPEQALKDADTAFGQAPTDADQQRETPGVQNEQARIDQLMDMKPDELQLLADKGDVDAQRALADIQRHGEQGVAGVENYVKQQAERPTPNAPAEQNAQTQAPEANATPAVETQQQPTTPEATPPVAETPTQPATPEAAKVTNPPLVEATAEGVVAEAEQATIDAAAETESSQTEAGAEEAKTPEQIALAERKQVIAGTISLAELGVNIASPEAGKVLDLLAENPQYAEAYNAAVDAAKANKLVAGPEGAAAATDVLSKPLDAKIAQAEKDGNTAEVKRLGFIKMLLKALGVALLVTAFAIVAAGAKIGEAAGAGKK